MSYNRRTLSHDSPFAYAAALLLFASAIIRGIYFLISGVPLDVPTVLIHLLLPIGCCAVMGIMLMSRKNSLVPTVWPMLFGVLFFMLKSLDFSLWHCVFCMSLYAAFALVYILTVHGVLGSRIPLMLMCALPFIFHVFVQDIFLSPPADFIAFLPELSVLLIMAAIFIEAWAMRRGRLY
jgi:hypothetical protein